MLAEQNLEKFEAMNWQSFLYYWNTLIQQFSAVAQLVEWLPHDQEVVGSNPRGGIFFCLMNYPVMSLGWFNTPVMSLGALCWAEHSAEQNLEKNEVINWRCFLYYWNTLVQQFSSVAQLVEWFPHDQEVMGSIPSGGKNFFSL